MIIDLKTLFYNILQHSALQQSVVQKSIKILKVKDNFPISV